jgi:hypothetical protein
MSRDPKPTDGVLAQPRSRRQFLAQLVTPVAAAAIAPALAVAATTKSAKKPATKPKPASSPASGDPFASARPDLSVAKTAEERATLEKQWKGLVDVLDVIRKAELPQSAAPALAFAAMPRDATSAAGSVARKKS